MAFRAIQFAAALAGATAVAVSVPQADAQTTWRQLRQETAYNAAYNRGRVTRHGSGEYTVVLRWNYTTPRTAENGRPYTRMIQQARVKCTPAPIRVKRFAAAVYGANGQLVEEAKPLSAAALAYMDWEALRPNTEGAQVYGSFCRAMAAPRRS